MKLGESHYNKAFQADFAGFGPNQKLESCRNHKFLSLYWLNWQNRLNAKPLGVKQGFQEIGKKCYER